MRPHCGDENTAETRCNSTPVVLAVQGPKGEIDFSYQPQKPNRPPTPLGPSPLRYPTQTVTQLRVN